LSNPTNSPTPRCNVPGCAGRALVVDRDRYLCSVHALELEKRRPPTKNSFQNYSKQRPTEKWRASFD
jgi:hypothetical protein